MKVIKLQLTSTLLLFTCFSGIAQKLPPTDFDTIPRAEVSITSGNVEIDGERIAYEATAGTMALRDIDNKPYCLFGYTAYIKQSEKSGDEAKRPIVFAFNGGPGSSSMWLHMGALGPKRILVDDPSHNPNAPYVLANNEYSILDVADVVMIDPVGTGLSLPLGKYTFKDFWGVDEDIESISIFIKQYLIRMGRINSPKYLLGESYGTFRNAGIMEYLQQQGFAMNGVIMVSAVFDLLSLTFPDGNDIPYLVHFPSYASTAWYHNKIENKPEDLEAFLDDVRAFTENTYGPALLKGDQLSEEEVETLAAQLSAYTGLSAEYWRKANLRVTNRAYFAELLRDEGDKVGRLDSRYRDILPDLLAQNGDRDPFTIALMPPFVTGFMQYLYEDLKVDRRHQYATSASSRGDFKWNWDHKENFSWGTRTAINTGPDLATAMTQNPNTKVLILNGYFDLATTFYGVEYSINHLGLRPEIKQNIIMKYYEAGHMMYVHEPSFEKFKKDIADFIRNTDNL